MKLRDTLHNIKNWMVFVASISFASIFAILLMNFSTSDFHVPMIFVLAVLVISLYTEGYFFGIVASVISVFAVNWAFTYPYLSLNFSISGYLLTFVTMLAVGIATSILSSRVRAQERIRIETAKEKMRATLLRSISHDLRTPLTSVSGSIAAVLDQKNPISQDEKEQLLENAKNEADWLCRMVDNLLSITRISGEQSEIHKELELVEEVIAEAISNFQIRNQDVKINVILPENPIFVHMDAMLLEQVIVNLLDNAVIHGKTTNLIIIDVKEYSNFVKFSVTDNGIGIDPAISKHLFDGSLLLTPLTTDSNKNMGIGLQVCKTIVEAHHGNIGIEKVNEGACFTFTIKK